MMMSPTSEVTMPPKAAPMMTPTARSTTLPFIANSRNSLSICSLFIFGLANHKAHGGGIDGLVDQAGMHHGATHRDTRRLRYRHHRQTQFLIHLAEQRKGIFHR